MRQEWRSGRKRTGCRNASAFREGDECADLGTGRHVRSCARRARATGRVAHRVEPGFVRDERVRQRDKTPREHEDRASNGTNEIRVIQV